MHATRLLVRNAALFIIIILIGAPLWSQSAPAQSSAVPPLPADIPSTAEHYSFLLMGNLAGQEAVWTVSDGALHIFFQFNDRGRGPKLTAILKFDPKGVPIEETITGNDYLKSPVNEAFSLSAGNAIWKNDAEHGEKKISAPAYYSPLNAVPSEIALLAHAAVHYGGKIALLPEGGACVQRVTELDVEAGSQKKHVALYSVAGLDFAPNYVLLEGDKDHEKFFASVDSWGSTIPEGWESAVKPLLAAQEKVKQSRSADLAAKLKHPAPGGIWFLHANVFDSEAGKIIPDQLVVVNDNRITSIGRA